MRLAPEDGQALDVLEPKREGGAAEVTVAPPPSRSSLVQELLQQALLGVLPIRRPLKPEEPVKFTPIHLCYVFDHVNGARGVEIAANYGHTEATVYRILNHPYTEVLEAALAGQMADKLTDPIVRMRAYAHEAIDVKVQIMRDPATSKQIKNSIAGDFLDRVGYGARKQIDLHTDDEAPPVPLPLMQRFVGALEEANRVRTTQPFEKFVRQGEGGGAVKAVPASVDAPAPSEQDSGGASPAGDPRSLDELEEKVA